MTPSFMKHLRLVGCIGAIALLCTSTFVLATGPVEHKVVAEAVASSITVQNGTATAKFVVQVTNYEDAAVTNFQVVFNEDFQVAVGDVAAGATAASGPQVISVDVSGSPTESLLLPVTYKFTVDGADAEMATVLIFRRAE